MILQDLITLYETSRQLLQGRIQELNALLRSQTFPTMEREQLAIRRDMLCQEQQDLIRIISEIRKHVKI